MEEPGSDDKGTSESHHIQQKRPYSVFRECEAGRSVTYSDGPVYKKMKGADHGRTRNLTKHKAGEVSYDKGQHEVGFDGRNVKKAANHDGTVMRQTPDDHSQVAHLQRRLSARLLKVHDDNDDDDDEEEEEVVRDGPRKGGKENSTSSSSGQSPGQVPNQPPGQPPNQPPDQPPNQPPDPAPNPRPAQSSTPPEASGSNAQGEGVGEQPSQFTDYGYLMTHRRLMSFRQCSDVVNSMAVQDRESSDSVDECSSSKQFCVAQPESCSSLKPWTQPNSQSDGPDGQYFKSPIQSQGSSSVQSSEYFTLKGSSHQETETGTDTVDYPTSLRLNSYYTVEETAQQMDSNSAAVLGQDPPLSSAQAPSDHQSEVTDHSEENQLSARTHSGDTIETDHLSIHQNQVPPTEDP